jgi:hypothetical protein
MMGTMQLLESFSIHGRYKKKNDATYDGLQSAWEDRLNAKHNRNSLCGFLTCSILHIYTLDDGPYDVAGFDDPRGNSGLWYVALRLKKFNGFSLVDLLCKHFGGASNLQLHCVNGAF